MKGRSLRSLICALGVAAACTSRLCFAVDQVTLSVGLFTRHVNPASDTNENNRFLAVAIDRWVGARYRNSYDNITHFVGRKWQTEKFNPLKDKDEIYIQGNLYGGFLHGYRDRFPNIHGITLGVAPTIAVGYQRGALELMYVPTDTGGVFMSLFSYTFGEL